VEDVASGWPERDREWWFGYMSNVKKELLAGRFPAEASHHLVRWLDHQSHVGGLLSNQIAGVQSKLIDLGKRW
jgi:hypothetical protein